MAIALVQQVNNGTGDGVGSLSLPNPAGAGNLLLAVAGRRGATYAGLAWDAVNNWLTLPGVFHDFVAVDPYGQVIKYRIAVGGETVTASWTLFGPEKAIIVEFSGVPTLDVAATTAAGADEVHADQTATFPAITPPSGRRALILAACHQQASSPNPGPRTLAGYTLASDTGFQGLGDRHRLMLLWREVLATAGSYGPVTMPASGAIENQNVIHAALLGAGAASGFFGDGRGGGVW